jgi:proton glutamate symport protein
VKLQTKILVGLVAGVAVGGVSRIPGAEWLQHTLIAIEPIGTVFIRLITMVVIPLVVASLFVGVAALGDVQKLGKIGGKTLAYFLGTTVIAATIGLVVATLFQVGEGAGASLVQRVQAPGVAVVDTTTKIPGFSQTLVALVPQNLFAAAASGDLLPLILGVCLFAAAATIVRGDRKQTILAFFEAMNDTAMVVVRWLMVLAPPAVFILMAATVATSGLDLLMSLLGYTGVVVGAMLVDVVVVLLPALVLGARQRVVGFIRGVADALMMAFSTASSNVTLPVSMEAARNRLGIPADVVSFVLPAGATLNKNGAAVYKAVTAVFIAHLYGVQLHGAERLTIVLASTVAAFAGAGVPGSSLVTTLIVLNAIGLGSHAAAGIALVAGIDRPIDMVRSTVNTLSNLIGAAWIGRDEIQI